MSEGLERISMASDALAAVRALCAAADDAPLNGVVGSSMSALIGLVEAAMNRGLDEAQVAFNDAENATGRRKSTIDDIRDILAKAAANSTEEAA